MGEAKLSGLHHLKIPVADLDQSLDWYVHVFDATHLSALDHVDSSGTRYAVLMTIPEMPGLVELRWAPLAAARLSDCDTIVFAVDSDDRLQDWVTHLDALGAVHSPILSGGGGQIVVIVDPDGKFIRLMTMPPNGLQSLSMPAEMPDPEGPWLNPIPMRHPRPDTSDAG